MSFVKRPKTSSSGKTVNPAGGVNPALEPNVSQYGWTSYDAAHVNQIIQYVNMCKGYADEAKDVATYIQGVYGETQEFIKYIESVYEELKPLADGLVDTYEDIVARHEDIKIRHADIITKHGEINTWHSETKTNAANAKDSADKAAVSETNAKDSETGSEEWYLKSKDIYDTLQDGQKYRGIWNPHTGSYPDAEGLNSVWDVILNEGELEFTFDGKKWYWGDRLVYIADTNSYQQIESGSGSGSVTSVNGKSGAVTLNATDVNALPITGGTLTGGLTVNSIIKSTNQVSVEKSTGYAIRITEADGVTYLQGGKTDKSEGNQKIASTGWLNADLNEFSMKMKSGTNPTVRWGSTSHAIYHQGYKPTANDVGAVPVTTTVNGKPLTSNITLEASDVNARPDTWLPTPQEIGAISSSTTINGKPLSANVSLNATDVGALPIAGGTLTGKLQVNSGGNAFNIYAPSNSSAYLEAKVGNVSQWYVGMGASGSNDVNLSSYTHGTTLGLRSDRVLSNKELYVNGYRVYHQGYKPTALDIQISNPLIKRKETLMDVIEELKSRISQLEEKINVQ